MAACYIWDGHAINVGHALDPCCKVRGRFGEMTGHVSFVVVVLLHHSIHNCKRGVYGDVEQQYKIAHLTCLLTRATPEFATCV